MQIPQFKLFSLTKSQSLWLGAIVGIGIAIAAHTLLSRPQTNSVWKYRFARPEIGQNTKNIQQEIAFYKQRIQQQPTAGLERASLAQAYVKMARATGESSWYLLAERAAQESLVKLPFNNYAATIVLAKIAAAKHDFTQSQALLKPLPPQAETLALSTTNYLALGDVVTARKQADLLVQKLPTSSNLTLRALVAVAQGRDTDAFRDFRAAISAEEPEEASNSAWMRTLLGRLYYKRGQLQQAEELYESALQILPQYPPALLNKGELFVRHWQANPTQGYYPTQTYYRQQAIEIYDRFFLSERQTPTVYDHIALRGLARVQKLQGDTAKANATWEQAVARLRSDLTGFGHRRELAQLLLERGQSQDRTEALALMQAELKLRQDAETWVTLAAAYLQLGQLDKAQAAIDAALKSGIRDPAIFDRAAVIARSRGQSAQAKKYRELVKSTDPLFDVGAGQALGLGVGLSGLN
jgi:tetratricopeptide (TPR) repeat protein